MKKKSLAILSLLCAASVEAQAQSGVTLYGVADAGVLYVNNQGGHSAWQAASGNQQQSRWGLRVVEDLGGGLSAIAQLENGFSVMNGNALQGGREFGRQAFVGLSSQTFGMLSFGRQYNPMQDMLSPLTAAITTDSSVYSGHPLDNDNTSNTYRENNTVKYKSAVYGGFQAEAMYAFSNAPGFAANRSYSFAASFKQSGLTLAAAYIRLTQPAFVRDGSGATSSDNYYSLSVTPALATAQVVQQFGAGGAYVFGPATIGLIYTGAIFERPSAGSLFSGTTGSGGETGSVRFQNIEGNVRYFFTPFLVGSVAETYTHATQGEGSGNYWQTSLGLEYFLSKRTNVYVSALYQRTSDNLHAWMFLTGAPSSTQSQVAGVVGVRHKF
ncbi:porin [Caballeronia sp. LZ035]|uniref:porin n=1 Tax=Caballeronia sp. LZ035 TaxID=3038568 RepID=UPI002862C115|nr:porin [Caballeronia sp. LZ035]MDR5759642.1 porin [Caballeronia sp. LZ035]